MENKKIVFVGHFLSPFAPDIQKSLKHLGFDVTYFDHYRPNWNSKVLGLVINLGLAQINNWLNDYINLELYHTVLRVNPSYVFLFKAKNISPETIDRLHSKGFCVINWYPDYYDDWEWISQNAALYDYFFTPCLHVQKELRKIGITSYYLPFATRQDLHLSKITKNYQATFVGRYTKRRDRLFRSVLNEELLEVWGYSHWKKTAYREAYHQQITPNQTKSIIRQSRITLNTITCEDGVPIISVNYRMFEATGVGGFVLTWYNKPLEDFFKIGKEVEIFTTAGEALDKTRYYLKHEQAREKIARAGWERTSRDHTYSVRLKQLFSVIK